MYPAEHAEAAADHVPSDGAEPHTPALRVAVGVATSGRPAILHETLRRVLQQSTPAAAVVVVYGKPEDIGAMGAEFSAVQFLPGRGGLCDKRNLILEVVADYDIVLFLDDDFLLERAYIDVLVSAFAADSRLAAATGTLLADGINGPGFTLEQAEAILRAAPASQADGTPAMRDVFNTYGCNMGFRLSIARARGLHFDTELPFYAWYEDIDFSRRIGKYGATRKLRDARGVHMGVKAGRISGRRLGYSQVANPVYLWRKGTYPFSHMVWSVGRNTLANLVRMFAPEPYVDRRGRAGGNLRAFGDLLRGRAHPTRILHMQ